MENFNELEKFANLGGIFVLAIFTIWNFFQLLKTKKEKSENGNKIDLTLEKLKIAERLTAIEVSFKDFEKRFDLFENRINDNLKSIYLKIEEFYKKGR